MKVGELRVELAKLKKEELIKVAAEFYKLIPKAKKEEYDLESLVKNPSKKKQKVAVSSLQRLDEAEVEIKQFIEHVESQYYLYSNRVVSRKARTTWRFRVKRWYKELLNLKRKDVDIQKQSELLSSLYELMSQSCGYTYFTAFDAFDSIGIGQEEFYRSAVSLIQEAEGKGEGLEKCIKLIVSNALSHDTVESDLMKVLVETLDIPILKEKGIEIVKKLIEENAYKEPNSQKSKQELSSSATYIKKELHNNLVELGYRLFVGLFETEEAVGFYKKHYQQKSPEVKLYILIYLLFESGKKEQIRTEIKETIKKGVKPRESLMKIFKEIEERDQLPDYW